MRMGSSNKIHQDINEGFGENAALLEARLKEVNWRYFAKVYAVGFGILLASLFVLIVVVRFAFILF